MPETVTSPSREKRDTLDSPSIEGVRVREDDIESVKGIRVIAWLFRGMAVLKLLLMVVQAAFWASTPTAVWKAVKAASNAGELYWDEFQMPFDLRAALR